MKVVHRLQIQAATARAGIPRGNGVLDTTIATGKANVVSARTYPNALNQEHLPTSQVIVDRIGEFPRI